MPPFNLLLAFGPLVICCFFLFPFASQISFSLILSLSLSLSLARLGQALTKKSYLKFIQLKIVKSNGIKKIKSKKIT